MRCELLPWYPTLSSLCLFLAILKKSFEILQAAEAADDEFYRRLRPQWRRLLSERVDEVQLLTLHALYAARGRLTLIELADCLPVMCEHFPRHRSHSCRELFFKFAQWTWDTFEINPREMRARALAVAVSSSGSGAPTTGV